MLFDATEWGEVSTNKWLECHTGRLEIRTNADSVLFVRQLGVDAIASTGDHHKVRTGTFCEYMVAMPGKDAVAYQHLPTNPVIEPQGHKFTNLERKPTESGTMLEVKKAVRELQIDAMLRRRALEERERERALQEREERLVKKEQVKKESENPAGQPENETPDEEPEMEEKDGQDVEEKPAS